MVMSIGHISEAASCAEVLVLELRQLAESQAMDTAAKNSAPIASESVGGSKVYLWWDLLAQKLGLRVEVLGTILAFVTIGSTWLIPRMVSPEVIEQTGFGDRYYLLAVNIMLAFISIPYGIRRSLLTGAGRIFG